MKRWIAMLLTVCMLISLCPVGVFAEPATGGTEPAQTVQTEQSATGATGVEPAANPVAVPETEKPTNPVAETKAAEPTAETKATEPTMETKATEPTAETKATEPTMETKVTEPTAETKATEPEADGTEPKTTEPAESTGETKPTESTEPTEETTEPTDATGATEETEASEPTDEETENTEPDADPEDCICEYLCKQGSPNAECPYCKDREDLTCCKGAVAVAAKTAEAVSVDVQLQMIPLDGTTAFGSAIRLQGAVTGGENAQLVYTWEYSQDGGSWAPLSGAAGDHYDFVLDEQNCRYYWKLTVEAVPEAIPFDFCIAAMDMDSAPAAQSSAKASATLGPIDVQADTERYVIYMVNGGEVGKKEQSVFGVGRNRWVQVIAYSGEAGDVPASEWVDGNGKTAKNFLGGWYIQYTGRDIVLYASRTDATFYKDREGTETALTVPGKDGENVKQDSLKAAEAALSVDTENYVFKGWTDAPDGTETVTPAYGGTYYPVLAELVEARFYLSTDESAEPKTFKGEKDTAVSAEDLSTAEAEVVYDQELYAAFRGWTDAPDGKSLVTPVYGGTYYPLLAAWTDATFHKTSDGTGETETFRGGDQLTVSDADLNDAKAFLTLDSDTVFRGWTNVENGTQIVTPVYGGTYYPILSTGNNVYEAQFYYLVNPFVNPMTNDTAQWGDHYGNGSVDLTDAVWSDGKNTTKFRIVSSPNLTIFQRSSESEQLTGDARVIADAYRATLKGTYGYEVEDSDILSIVIVPYKVSRNNGTKPDRHVDCTVTVICKNIINVEFLLRGEAGTNFTKIGNMVGKGSVAADPRAAITSYAAVCPETKTIDGHTYTFTGWYDNESLSGTPVTFPKTVSQNQRYYAGYVRTDWAYTVNYLDADTGDAVAQAKIGDGGKLGNVIKAEDEKVEIRGYNFVRVDKDELTITEGENVLKIYYEKDPSQTKQLSYTVHYYKDGEEQTGDETTVTESVWVNDADVLTVTGKIAPEDKYPGYKLSDENESFPGVGTSVENGSEYHVYYVKDESQTQPTSYTVRHVVEGEEKDTNTYTGTAWVNETDPTIVIKAGSLTQKIYTGYRFESMTPSDAEEGKAVKSGTTIVLTYVKDETKTKPTTYTVKHIVGGEEEYSNTYTGTAWINETNPTIVVEAGSLTQKTYTGYKFESIDTEAKEGDAIASGTVITLTYVKRTDLTYTVKYLWTDGMGSGTAIEGVQDKVVEDVTFGQEILEDPIEIPGYTPVETGKVERRMDKESLTIVFPYYKNVTLTAASDSAVYNGTTQTLNGYTSSEAKAEFEGITASGSGKDVGEYAVTFNGVSEREQKISKNGRYLLTGTVDGKLTITPREAVITVNNGTKTAGRNDPAFTGTVTGLIGENDLGVVSYVRTNNAEAVGTYTDVLTALYTENANYDVRVINGTFVITAANNPNPNPPQPNPNPPQPNPNPPQPQPQPEPEPEVEPEAGPEVEPEVTPEEPQPAAPDAGPVEEIADEETPLAMGGAWALVNLILTVLTVLGSILLLIGYIGKKQKEREDENGNVILNAEGEAETDDIKKKGGWRLASIIPAVAAVIAFILTENMRLPMVLVDKWTLLMVIIALVQLLVAYFSKKKTQEPEQPEQMVANA